MGLFDRFKNMKETPASGYDRMSAMGDDPDSWNALKDDELKHLVIMKCLEYGTTQTGSLIPKLFALYSYAKTRLDRSERMQLLTQFSGMTEEQRGQGHMGLMMFLIAEDDPAICSTAAMSLAVLFDPKDGDRVAGPQFVVRTLLNYEPKSALQGKALGGIFLLGDKRILALLENAWPKLSDDARLGLSQAKSGFVSEGMVEFWLGCLEIGCSEAVFGSVAAAIAKMPAIAQVPFVLDVQRVLPAYEDSENPMRIIRQTSFGDYLEEIRPHLEALEAYETEPKVIPKIFENWENPERFRGRIG